MFGTIMTFLRTFLGGFLGGWRVKLAIVVSLLFGAYMWHTAEVKIAVNKAVQEIRYQSAKEDFKLKDRSLDAKIALQESFDNIQKDKDAKLKTLNTRVATLTASLRSRPNRPETSGVPDNTSTKEGTAGATGVRLYRADAELLSWFSGQTAELQVELQGCYKSYDEAKETLDRFKLDNTPGKL